MVLCYDLPNPGSVDWCVDCVGLRVVNSIPIDPDGYSVQRRLLFHNIDGQSLIHIKGSLKIHQKLWMHVKESSKLRSTCNDRFSSKACRMNRGTRQDDRADARVGAPGARRSGTRTAAALVNGWGMITANLIEIVSPLGVDGGYNGR